MIQPGLWHAAVELQRYLDTSGYRFCCIGGIVVQRWGQPRLTVDVDGTILTPFGNERQTAESILKRYEPRVAKPLEFAMRARVLLIQDRQHNKIDLTFGGMPFEERMMDRSTMWGIEGYGEIRTCGAEDLIVLKAFASRPQDWIDVETVIIRQGEQLDQALIREELTPLVELKEEPQILIQLASLFQKHI
jgi:hypothetical protein